MRKSFNILKIISLCSILLAVGTVWAQTETFEWQGVQRQYLIRTPSSMEGQTPVLYFLHGLGDNITRCDQEFNFAQLAEEFGWVIVVPQARNLGIGNMWNAGLIPSSVDDAGFLLALLDTLTLRYNLNPDSVFFTGFSMGGFMTHKMAIEHGDRFTAGAPVSGLITTSLAAQAPVAPVRMLHIHGDNDAVVGYDGNSSAFGGALGISVEAILDFWKAANGCNGEPHVDTMPDTHNDGLRFIHYTYNCGTDFQFLKVIGGTHTWYYNDNQYDVNYWHVIHDFFEGKDFSPSGLHDSQKVGLRVAPNPSDGLYNVEVGIATTITVIDQQGRIVLTKQIESGVSQLDLRHLSEGVYNIRTTEGKTTKVVVL